MAENLWALREQKKLSVAALANRAGLPIGIIVEYESGQRSVDPRHLGRLARALYVEEAEIRLHSDPRPEPRREELRAGPRDAAPVAAGMPPPRPARPPRERAPRPKPAPKPPAPARPSQIAHIESLLQRVGRTRTELEDEIGKPLGQLDRPGATQLIKALQTQLAQTSQTNRHRAYLPESVDQFEAAYLTAAQRASSWLHFTMFDGSHAQGTVIGFGPYSITIRQADGAELTIAKLAVVSYQALAAMPAVKGPAA